MLTQSMALLVEKQVGRATTMQNGHVMWTIDVYALKVPALIYMVTTQMVFNTDTTNLSAR